MSETSANPVPSGTGVHPVLSIESTATPVRTGGKAAPETGKPLPQNEGNTNLGQVVEQLNGAGTSIGRDLRFEVDLDSGRSVIQVLDRDTGEIIRQIPPEKVSPYIQANGAIAVRLYDEVV